MPGSKMSHEQDWQETDTSASTAATADLCTLSAALASLRSRGLERHEPVAHYHERLAHVTRPLPGSQPYRRVLEFSVTGRYDRASLGAFLTGRFPQVEPDYWRARVANGYICVEGAPVHDWAGELRAGMRLRHAIGAVIEPPVATQIEVLYNDAHLIAVSKPAPLPVHPCGRFNKNSLAPLLEEVLKGERLRPPHRLDADTSGVQLLAKTRASAQALTRQFAARSVEKHYLARVDGHPSWGSLEMDATVARDIGQSGRRSLGPGDAAYTHLQCLERLADGTALLLAQPQTGRTNQIRLHLRACGHPVRGDVVYGSGAGVEPDPVFSQGTLHLHALALAFDHPVHGHRMRVVAAVPDWAQTATD